MPNLKRMEYQKIPPYKGEIVYAIFPRGRKCVFSAITPNTTSTYVADAHIIVELQKKERVPLDFTYYDLSTRRHEEYLGYQFDRGIFNYDRLEVVQWYSLTDPDAAIDRYTEECPMAVYRLFKEYIGTWPKPDAYVHRTLREGEEEAQRQLKSGAYSLLSPSQARESGFALIDHQSFQTPEVAQSEAVSHMTRDKEKGRNTAYVVVDHKGQPNLEDQLCYRFSVWRRT